MMPQFSQQKSKVKFRADLSIGLTMLVVGLFKKVVIADDLAEFANPIFSTVYQTGVAPDTVDAWVGMLSYGLQLYFDFSGYSDMAIGSARLFGIRFPMNFNSPYQATSIVDFWRRWHMTLSRFLRDYLYIAMGGGRVAQWRRYMNLMLTMALGGIWHGAGWNFLIWGLVHGLLLCVNHFWDQFNRAYLCVKIPRVIAAGMTLLVVMMLWVIFRAPDLGTAIRMLGALWRFDFDHVQVSKAALVTIALSLTVVWALPNTQQWMSRYGPCIESLRKDPAQQGGRRWWHWRPTKGWALAVCLTALAVAIKLDRISEFIYFQF
jgi:D-alanyl-lipoteichoic acid acyltransferase DltB (MBOAT superfamily)